MAHRDLTDLTTWAERLGVSLDLWPPATGAEDFYVSHIERSRDAAPGEGWRVLEAACAFVDARRAPLLLTVTGHNTRLEAFYARAGFRTLESERCAETGDVPMRRPARTTQRAAHAVPCEPERRGQTTA